MSDESGIIYSNSPNVQVPDENGVLRRANLVAIAPGEIVYQDNEKSTNVQVMGDDGNLHRAQLVAVIGGSGGGSVDETKIIVKSPVIPEASSDTFGKFYCYSGETDNTYTHGYVYECLADASSSYIIDLYNNSGGINKLAFDYEFHSPIEVFERIASLSTPTFDPSLVHHGTLVLDKPNELWYITGYDAENNLLFQDFTISGTGDQYSLDAYGFVYIDRYPDNFEDGYSDTFGLAETTVYSNYRWERMDLQPAAKLGRYLTTWNCATGMAQTNPTQSPYVYTTGDYFIVGAIAAQGGTNYRPSGTEYVEGQASTTIESEHVAVNDTYLYDGSSWTLLKTSTAVTSVNGQIGDVSIGINDVAPTQTGNAGKVLTTDGTNASWATVGGGDSIVWDTTIDVPANSGLGNNAFPIYTISGGLPDGEYEFYWQIKCQGGYEPCPFGLVTYKARFKVVTESGDTTAKGQYFPVINGQWFPSQNYTNQYGNPIFGLFYKKDNDWLMMSSHTIWRTDAVLQYPDVAIPECFKISKIKNIDTGTEYSTTGYLNTGVDPTYDTYVETAFASEKFAKETTITFRTWGANE